MMKRLVGSVCVLSIASSCGYMAMPSAAQYAKEKDRETAIEYCSTTSNTATSNAQRASRWGLVFDVLGGIVALSGTVYVAAEKNPSNTGRALQAGLPVLGAALVKVASMWGSREDAADLLAAGTTPPVGFVPAEQLQKCAAAVKAYNTSRSKIRDIATELGVAPKGAGSGPGSIATPPNGSGAGSGAGSGSATPK